MSIILFVCSISLSHATCTVIDDAGQRITLSHPAQRIISLAPDLTETLFAIGAGKQVQAVLQGSDYPLAAQQLPLIGSYTGIDLERVIALRPDLIVTWGHAFARQLTLVSKLGIPIYHSDPHHLVDIPHTIRQLGCLTGTAPQAEHVAKLFSLTLTNLHAQYATQKPIRVFYQIGEDALFTINHSSWINEAIMLCGGQNVFAQAKLAAPQVNWEAIIAAHPEAVISDTLFTHSQASWKRWPTILAVQQHNLFLLDPSLIERPGPRVTTGVSKICAYLQIARTHLK